MEKVIDLRKIPVVWTTCEKTKNRHESMELMLKELGLSSEKVCGPVTTPYPIGVAEGYIDALSRHKAPFLSLEDDATLIPQNLQMIFNIPDDADALYIGTSVFGRIRKTTVGGGTITADAGEYFRVFNMLGFHGIIYLNQSYVDDVIQMMKNYLKNPVGGCDEPIAESMWKHKIYAVKKPMFYQKDGTNDQGTIMSLQVVI